MKKKSNFQKLSIFFAITCFIASIACVIYLFLNVERLTWQSPISASLLASTFFFAFICFVFFVIGTSNIPSFKVGEDSN